MPTELSVDWQAEKEKIRQLALEEIGIDIVGFATADDFTYMKDSLEEQKKLGHTTGFEHKIIEERLYPESLLDGAQSIISIGLAYPSKPLYSDEAKKGERRGQFAKASWGRDYHFILEEHLAHLAEKLEALYPNFEYKSMVDTGELMDVVVAYRAGLGFIGKNGLLINEKYGSYLYLGEMITNLPLPPDKIVANGCGDCSRCLDYCPTGALLGDGRMNATICLSYLTQTKDYIPEKYRKRLSNQLYGCDICQDVCPYNKGIDVHHHPEMEAVKEEVNPELKPILSLSNREFKEKFGHLAGAWRGKKPLQRNAINALANYRDRTAIPLLLDIMENDPRPMIRGTAADAISKIQREYNEELIDFFEDCLAGEDEQETIKEISQALERLREKKRR